MKTISKISKTALLCVLFLFAAKSGSAQLFPATFTTTQGQCVDLGIDSFLAGSGLTLDSFSVAGAPQHGQLVPGGRPGSWFYCPDSAFTGTDQAMVYYCVSGPTFPICDSVMLTFVVQPAGLCNTLTVVIQPGPCAGPLPSLQATATGGTPPYQYWWSNGMTNDVVCNLTTGSYCVAVIDANGCSVSSCQSVGSGCQLTVSVAMDSSGCLVPSVTGGVMPYSYLWSDSSTGSVLCNFNPLNLYWVVVTDDSGCAVTATYGIGCQIAVVVFADSMSCGGGNGLTAVVTGGTQPYTYLWNTRSTGTTICPTIAGQYCVTVTDAQGCADVQCGTAGGGCRLTVALSYDSLNNCITPAVAGGTPPYTYFWSDGSMQPTHCNVAPDTAYCISVADANGCTGSACSGQNQGCSFSYTQGTPGLASVVVFAASFDSLLNPANVTWDLGDGNSGSGFQFTHIYDTCDVVYTVTMTLVDSLGNNLCSYTQPVYVYCFPDSNRYCQAYFYSYQVPDSNGNISPLTFHFADQSVYSPATYQWDFGDGNSSALPNPQHTYATGGLYNVCLVITTADGCSSTYCEQVNAGNVPVQDLSVYLYHYTTVTPGFPLWVNLSYCNYGTILMNGTVEYRYPAGTTFVSATPPPTSHNAAQRLLTFDFTNLLPGTCGSIAVDLTVSPSLSLGSVANDTMWVKPIAGDNNPADNISTVTEMVTGSWDPNDKAVSPKGYGDDGEIPMSTQTLSYKIRFQNTGTAPAQNVVLRDVIDSNIDLASVKVMDASHEHITQIIGSELVVTFNNIMLPDSNSNEPASHGYIQVVADLKPGLSEGAQILNTAEIHFDFNEPVITNKVVNTLKNATGIRQIAGLEFSILPNPAQDEIVLLGKFSRNAQYEVLNGLGQAVLSGNVTSDHTKISLAKLNAGIYFVQVKSAAQSGVERLVVTE